jgi:ubiquinone/menaquinone biosynthesis C-methylase UbiE
MSQARLITAEDESPGANLRGVSKYWQPLGSQDRKALKHRDFIGGMWEEIGALQMEFLRSCGLLPSHNLLDVGCGCLRGGVHFVRYLEPGHYFGVDVNRSLLEAGLDELEQAGLEKKGSVLIESSRFEFQKTGQQFDFAIAVSVFTHLFMNHIVRCLVEMKRVLKSDCTFYATYFEAPVSMFLETLSHHNGKVQTHYDQNPFHISAAELASLAAETGFAFERIGDWGHPRGQMMAAFTA